MSDYIYIAAKKSALVLIGVTSTMVLARYLGPELRGQYAYIISLSALLVVFFNFGLNVNYQSARKEAGDIAALPYFFFATLQIFSILCLASIVLYFFSDSDVKVYIVALLISSFSLLRMQLSHYNLIENIKHASIIAPLSNFIFLFGLFVLYAFFSAELWWVVFVFLIKEFSAAFLSGMSLFFIWKSSCINHTVTFSRLVNPRVLLNIKLSPYLVTILVVVIYKLDILMLQYFSIPDASIGVFAMGVILAEYLWIFSDVVKDVQTKRTSTRHGPGDLVVSLKLAMGLMLLGAFLILLFGYWGAQIMFGKEFKESYYISVIMLLPILSMLYVKVIGTYYLSSGRGGVYLIFISLGCVVNFILNLFLIPGYGIYGAAAASFFSYIICSGVFVLHFSKIENVSLAYIVTPSYQPIVNKARSFLRQ